MIHSTTEYFKEKYGQKYLVLDSTVEYDDMPLNKPLKFPTLTIIIRCVFQEGENLYPQIYLDECLYK